LVDIDVARETFRLAETFTISRGSRNEARVLTVRITHDGKTGWGECVPYARYGETLDTVEAQIGALPPAFDRTSLQSLLPPGAARNAVDCALWCWEARHAGRPAWALAGLPIPGPRLTAFTLSLDDPARMAEAAWRHADRPLLKIKLGSPDDLPRLEAVRQAVPHSRIIVDANEGWTPSQYHALVPHLRRLQIALVEQPFPADDDEALRELPRPVPVCADESCHDRDSLDGLVGKYDMVNIKLDKTGGLTEGLELLEAARAAGLAIMVGCMVGSSLAMAPAVLLAQDADFVDLDGPLLLAEDRETPLQYDDHSRVHPPEPALWG
jgi:L-alanine-DL-glutamate epimerase-like enolase superfamily enzyme